MFLTTDQAYKLNSGLRRTCSLLVITAYMNIINNNNGLCNLHIL